VGFEELLSRWKSKRRIPGVYADIHDGSMWQDWQSLGGKPFLAENGIALSLNVDFFQPFTGSSYSVGVLFAVLLNLPRELRYLRENIVILGLIPGPTEPRNIMPFLSPLVDELEKLYDGVRIRTATAPEGRLIRAALMLVNSDLPAARKVAGFVGVCAHRGCSRCNHYFPSEVRHLRVLALFSSAVAIVHNSLLMSWLSEADLWSIRWIHGAHAFLLHRASPLASMYWISSHSDCPLAVYIFQHPWLVNWTSVARGCNSVPVSPRMLLV
jgi:hypothetical protein